MMTVLKIMICLAAIAVGFPIWFPVLMSLFGITMGFLGAAIGLFSAFFALVLVGGVLTFVFALPALVLLAVIAGVFYSRTKRSHISA